MFFIILLASLLSAASTLESNFYAEEPCIDNGGYCVLENECPNSLSDDYKSLCKTQKSLGAICCKNFPIEELNCDQSHNECRKPEECPINLSMGKKGCGEDKICCTLI